jgi:hypothetical protein
MVELTEYENDVLDTLKNLANKVGAMKYYHFDEKTRIPNYIIIAKRGDIWVSYVFERNEETGFCEYDDIYDAVVDSFDYLSLDLTYYLTNNFPSKESFKEKHKVK